MENLSSHLNDVMYVPIFTPPTDGVKRPHQLLKIMKGEDGRYLFDWRDVRRWVSMARSCGLEYFEWTHLFTQWGAKYAIRIYENWDGDYRRLLWPPETLGTSDAYRDFLSQFLPEFKRFLEEEGIMERSLFHISDEPHGDEHLENYRKCSGMVREIAPWIKVMDAQSDPAYARLGLTDIPIAGIHVSEEFNRLGIPHFDYYCCGPRGKFFNRHLDVPLVKVRGTAWVLYRFKSLGFLHWGYNYWYKAGTTTLIDPYCVTDGLAWPIWAYGDTFVVFPGEEGPVDSIRWEVLADSFSDYALLQSCGVDPEDPLLGQIQSYEEFPKYKEWYGLARAKLLSGIGDKWKSCRKAVEKPSKGHREAV